MSTDNTSRPDREPKKGDKVRDPHNDPERLSPVGIDIVNQLIFRYFFE